MIPRRHPVAPGNMKVVPFVDEAPEPAPTAAEIAQGCILFSRPITQPVYRNTRPLPWEAMTSLATFATQGEYEPLTFSVYPLRDMRNFRVLVSDLASNDETIGKANVDLRLVTYWNMRYPMYTTQGTFREQPELLERVTVNSFAKGECQRYWLTIKVPPNAKPGMYQGHVTLFDDNASKALRFPIRVRVLGYRLIKDPNKHFSSFHLPTHHMYTKYTGDLLNKAIAADLENMQRYGFDTIPFVYVKARRSPDGDEFYFDARTKLVVRKAIALGLKGPITICGGLNHFCKRYVPGGTFGAHFKVSKYPADDKIYTALETAVRKFKLACQKEGYPELIYLLVDEPRQRSAEFCAKLFAAVRRGGMKTVVTNDPTSAYAHFYRDHDSLDAWWSQAFAMPYEKIVADTRYDYWCYPNHNAGEIKDRVVMQKGGRMTYGYGFWRSGYTRMVPWAWRWFPGGKNNGKQFDYLMHPRQSGTGNRLDEKAHFIPAVYWECFREGYDDGRYLYTLQQAMAERRDSTDPNCQEWIRKGQKLLDEIWRRVQVKRKYMKVDFWEDATFSMLRWRIARLTMALLKHKGRTGVVAPSVMADTATTGQDGDDGYTIQKGLKDGVIEYLDLAKDAFKGWRPTGDKELNYSVKKNLDQSVSMHLNLHVNHKVDGLHKTNKYPIGWPYVAYDLRKGNVNLLDYTFLHCKIRFDSNRDAVADDVTRMRFVFRKAAGAGESGEVIDLGGNERTWGTVQIHLDESSMRNAAEILLLPSEAYFPDQTKIDFCISEIGLLKFTQPIVTRIHSTDTLLTTDRKLKVGAFGFAFGEGAKDGYVCEVMLKDTQGRAVVKECVPLQKTLQVVVPLRQLHVGAYKLTLKLIDKAGNIKSTDSKRLRVIEGYACTTWPLAEPVH